MVDGGEGNLMEGDVDRNGDNLACQALALQVWPHLCMAES